MWNNRESEEKSMKEVLIMRSCLFIMKQSTLEVILGDLNGSLYALTFCIVVDFLLGVLVAVLNKNLSIKIAFRGIVKKVSIFFLVAVGHVVDIHIIQNETMIRTMVILFYFSNEGISILRNVEKLGLPIPKKLKIILEWLEDGE